MIRNIKKKIISFFLLIITIFGLFGIFNYNEKGNVKAANNNLNQWVAIGGTNAKIRVCYTENLFVNAAYSNCITSVPSTGEFYMTVFVDVGTTLRALEFQWNLDSTEVASTALIIGKRATTDRTALIQKAGVSSTNAASLKSCLEDPYADYTSLPDLPGRTYGSSYVEGDAISYLYSQEIIETGSTTFANNKMMVSQPRSVDAESDNPSGKYVAFKAKVTLNSNVKTFNSTAYTLRVTENSSTVGVFKGNDVDGLNPNLITDMSASLGPAAASTSVETAVEATNNSNSVTKNLTSSTTNANFTFDATDSSTTTFKVKVDNGKGTIVTSSLPTSGDFIYDASSSTISAGNNEYAFKCTNTKRGAYSTISFAVTSEDSSNTETYTINVQRKPIITGMTFTSSGNYSNPIITKGSNSQTDNPVSNFADLAEGTYYIWASASLQQYTLSYTFDAKASSLNNSTYTSGNKTLSAGNNVTIKLTSDDSSVSATYKFIYKTITDNVGLSSITGTPAGITSQVNGTLSGTNGTITFNYSYNGTTVTSANIVGTATTPSKSTVTYSTDGNTYSSTAALVSFTNSNTQTVYIKVKDNNTSAEKIYTITVKRTVRTVTDTAVTATNSTSQTGTLTSTNKTLNFTFPYSATASTTLKIKVDAGNGAIGNIVGATNNGVNNGEYTLELNPTNRGSYSQVTFDAIAQDGVTTNSYNINIQVMPVITGMTFTSVGNYAAPIITANNASNQNSGVINGFNNLAPGTYKIWVSSQVTNYNVSFTFDGSTATLDGNAYVSGTKQIGQTGFTIKLLSATSDTSDYTFVYQTITDQTGLNDVKGTPNGGSVVNGVIDSTNNAKYTITVPYKTGNTVHNTVTVVATPTNSSSIVEYSTSSNSGWASTANVVNFSGSTNSVTIYVKVTDSSTQGTKIYTVVVERTVSSNVSTVVIATNDTNSKNGTLTSTNKILNFTFATPNNSSTTLKIKVDSGNGTISNVLGAQLGNHTTDGEYTITLNPTNRGQFSQITFDVLAQDGSTGESYTINVQREPIITSMVFTKDDGAVDPIVTKGSGSSSSTPVTNFADLVPGTYYVWVSSAVQNFFIQYNADCISTSLTPLNTQIQMPASSSFTIVLTGDDNKTVTYTFTIKTITASTGLNQPSVNGTGSTTTGTISSSTSNSKNGTDYIIKVPYQDNNGNVINSVEVTAPPTSTTGSTLEYWDDTNSQWVALGSPYTKTVTIDNVTSKGNIKYRVTDNVSGDVSEYNITVEREAADTDTSIKDIKVYDITSNATYKQGTWTGTTYQLNDNLPYNTTKLRFVIETTSQYAKMEIETVQYANTATHTHNVSQKNAQVEVVVKVTPQSGLYKEYKISYYVNDQRSSDTTLKSFEVINATDSTIIDPTVTSPIFMPGQTTGPFTLEYEIPYSVSQIKLNVVPTKEPTAKVYGAKTTSTAATKNLVMSNLKTGTWYTYNYYVYAEDETWSDVYTIKIKRMVANTDVGLDDLYFVNSDGNTIYPTDKNTGVQFVGGTRYNTNQTFEYILNLGAGNSIQTFVNNEIPGLGITKLPFTDTFSLSSDKYMLRTFILKSESGVTLTYKIHIFAASEDKTINGLNVLDGTKSTINGTTVSAPVQLTDTLNNQVYVFSSSNKSATATISYSSRFVFFEFLKAATTIIRYNSSDYTNKKMELNSSTIDTLNTLVFEVYSEYEMKKYEKLGIALTTSDTYTFNLTVKAPGIENRLNSLTSNSGTIQGGFNPDSKTIYIENCGQISSVTVNVTKKESYETVVMPGQPNNSDNLTYTHQCQWNSSTETFTIQVYPEDKSATPRTYQVILSKGAANASSDTTLGFVTIDNDLSPKTNYYSQVPTSVNENSPETVTMGVGETAAVITVDLPAGSAATPFLEIKGPDDSTYTSCTLQGKQYPLALTPSLTGVVKYMLKVYVKAGNNVDKSDDYYIEITVPQVSDDKSITSIVSNGTSASPDVNDKAYIEAPLSKKDNLDFTVNSGDPNATVTITPTGGVVFTPSTSDGKSGTLSGLDKGLNTVIVNVKSTDGKDKNYTSYVWIDEDPTLDNLEVLNYTMSPVYNPATNTYEVTVSYSDTQETIKYTLPGTVNSSLLSIKYYLDNNSSSLNNFQTFDSTTVNLNAIGDTVVTVVVSQAYPSSYVATNSLASSTTTYKITIKKEEASQDCDLLTIDETANGGQTNSITNFSNSTPTVLLYDRQVGSVTISNITIKGKRYVLTATNSFSPINDDWLIAVTTGGMTTVNVRVYAEDEQYYKDYQFILIAADTDKDVTDLELLDTASSSTISDVNNDTLQFAQAQDHYGLFTYIKSTLYIKLKITKPYWSNIYINGNKIVSPGTEYTYLIDISQLQNPNKLTTSIYLESEAASLYSQLADGKSITYTIEMTHQALDIDAKLKMLEAYSNLDSSTDKIGAQFTPNDEGGTYTVTNLGSATSVTIKALPNKLTTRLNNQLISNDANPFEVTLPLNALSSNGNNWGYTFEINTVAEDGVTKYKYIIQMFYGSANADDDNTLIGLEVIDSNSVYYVARQTTGNAQVFNATTETYNITIPYGAASYTITPFKLSGSHADLIVTDIFGTEVADYLQTTITSSMYGQTYTHWVYAKNKSGLAGTKYSVIVTIEKPSSENGLLSLTADGDELIDPNNPTLTTFHLNRNYTDTTIDIQAILKDTKGTISGDIGIKNLQPGTNTFTVIVTAQDGTPQPYTIIVERALPDPTLYDLGVTGEKLLDMNRKATTFDSDTKEYRVIVPYTKTNADIYASSSNADEHITGIGNVNLSVGTQTFPVVIFSKDGTRSTTYRLVITRLPEETMNASLDTIKIEQMTKDGNIKDQNNKNLELIDKVNQNAFADEFDADKIYYGIYHLVGKVSSLNVIATPQIAVGTADYDPATIQILGADNLHIGKNQVVILVTAPDGIHQKAYVIEVERDDIAYNVLEDQIESDGYTLEKVVDKLEYNINIGKKKTSEVDFLSYIEALNATGDNAEQELEITYKTNIENNPDDVIIEIATKDGITKQVIFHVESTSNHNNADFWTFFPLIILLVIVLIILIMILISVNKDKYGKITRKADKKSDKKEKAANK